jgi:pimeloyl-ACP methyl ester carboxylesterase
MQMHGRTVFTAALALALSLCSASQGVEMSTNTTTTYHSILIEGVQIFYREAGPASAPTILLLHGFPSSSRMFATLMPLLADRYHLIAPDYPGFGHSDAPDPQHFAYTFDHLADVIDRFSQSLKLQRYVLFMQDYGGPVGFRLALAHPERAVALIIQNAVAHEEGLGPLWEARRAYWRDRSANEERLRANLISFEATRQRHVGSSPHPERYDPDTWTDEFAFLSRPGQVQIQSDLFFDYRTNVASYPRWQAYLRAHLPPTLVLWGKYDPSFTIAGGSAYGRDVPDAEIHVLDAGHFATDESVDEIAILTRQFLERQHVKEATQRWPK